MDEYIYIIDCLRQVVAFAPKVINCAVGEILIGGWVGWVGGAVGAGRV